MLNPLYKIVNKIDGKVYVGSTYRDVELRFREHCYPSNQKPLGRDIQKHGVDNFEFTVLERVSFTESQIREKFWIDTLNSLVPNGYNVWYGYFPFS